MTPCFKGVTCLIDSLEIGYVTIENKCLPRCKIIEEETKSHDSFQFFIRQVLIEHGQIIAEIQERFHRITLRKRTATDMIDHAIGNTYNSSAQQPKPPTEINFLVMRKKTTIKSTCIPVIFRTNQQTCTCSPHDIGNRIRIDHGLLQQYRTLFLDRKGSPNGR